MLDSNSALDIIYIGFYNWPSIGPVLIAIIPFRYWRSTGKLLVQYWLSFMKTWTQYWADGTGSIILVSHLLVAQYW